MSAYLVSDRQISAILQAVYGVDHSGFNIWQYQTDPEAYHFVFGLKEKAQTEANELMAENVRSVNHCYPHHEPETAHPVQLDWDREPLAPLTILKLIDNLQYQSCECPDYRESAAYKLMCEYREKIIPRLAGYLAEPWGIR